ncbi:MAG: BamA/TamA family outer membrane protein [Candidatus Latescibacteria bacterium]|nr:BamA/TamA family outer membrane protein [Candidatus Latescibacterota bacterium]
MTSTLRHARISRRLMGLLIAVVFISGGTAAVSLAASSPEDSALLAVEGNRAFSEEQIVSLLRNAGWRSGDKDRAIETLQAVYFSEGYLFSIIHLEKRDAVDVVIIDEGEQPHFSDVRLYGAREYPEAEVRKALGIGAGELFNPRKLDERIDGLLRRYDEIGFPFAQVWVDSLEIDPKRREVNVVLYVVEGGAKRLQNIEIEGLEKTRESLVVEMSGLEPGEPYSGKSIDDAYIRLSSSGIFDEVAYPKVRLSPGGNGVEALFAVREPRRFNTFSSAVGYAKAEAGDDDVLSGTVRLNLQNIGGTLRDLSIFWNNDGAGKNSTRLAYKDRFIFGRNLSLGLSVEQVGLDTLYTWQSVGLQVERPLTRIGGSLLTLTGAIHGDRNVFSEGELLRSWRVRIAGGFSYLKGSPGRSVLHLDGKFTWAHKKFYTRSDGSGRFLSQYIAEAMGRAAIDFSRVLHLRNETVYKGLESSESIVPLSEQFYIGGAKTLRGYREDQFHGRRIAYSRLEFIIGKRTVDNAYLFADCGYVLQETEQSSGDVNRRNLFRAGYGFGLRTASKLGKVDISFGVGERISLRQTKVHVILEQTF